MTTTATVRLSDLCDLVAEQTNPRDHPNAVYVGLEHAASGRFVRVGRGSAEDVQSSKYRFKPGDVLYSKLRPYLDKAILVDDAGVCTTELLVLRPKNGVEPRFVVGVVHSPAFIEHAVSGTTGVQHPRTSWSHISNFELPEFTRTEKSKIATLLWRVHDAISINEATIAAGTALKLAAMRTLFSCGLRGEVDPHHGGPVGWREGLFSDLCVLQRGYDLPQAERKHGSIPVIGSNGIVGYHDSAMARGPGVVIGRSGTLGKSTFCGVDFWPLNTGLFVTDFRGNEPRYVHYYCQWFDFSKFAAGVSVPTLNRNLVHEANIFLPLRDEQKKIADILTVLDRKLDLHLKKRGTLEALFRTLLHKLMTGTLRVNDLDLSDLSLPDEAPGAHEKVMAEAAT